LLTNPHLYVTLYLSDSSANLFADEVKLVRDNANEHNVVTISLRMFIRLIFLTLT
jgi:hypothetical protein